MFYCLYILKQESEFIILMEKCGINHYLTTKNEQHNSEIQYPSSKNISHAIVNSNTSKDNFKNVALHQSERNMFLKEVVVVRRNDTSINAVMNDSKIARPM